MSFQQFGAMQVLTLLLVALFVPRISNTQETAKVIIEAQGGTPPDPRIYRAAAVSTATIHDTRVEHSIRLSLETIQGSEGPYSIELIGNADVTRIEGDQVLSWAVRKEGARRFLELTAKPEVKAINPLVTLRSQNYTLPRETALTHFGIGKAASFSNTIEIVYEKGVAGKVVATEQFLPLSTEAKNRFHTSSGGSLTLKLTHDESVPPPVRLSNASLSGSLEPDSQSVRFQYTSEAIVTEKGSSLKILAGDASMIDPVGEDDYSIRLVQAGQATYYEFYFPEPGSFHVRLNFASRLVTDQALSNQLNFTIHSDGVMPIELSGVSDKIEFLKGNLHRSEDKWSGFLPADGKVALHWKPVAERGDGKLFFRTTGLVETRIGAGLCQQTHQVTYHVLQGKLAKFSLKIVGDGEIVSVSGKNLLSWKIDGETLEITLNEAIDRDGAITVKSQLIVDALPARVTPLRLEPLGTIRHSGFVRLANDGSVRLEPSGLQGLSQLSPDKFPGKPIKSRQVFAYRFPSSSYQFSISSDRIQPEVHVSEISLYNISASDQTIDSTIELDIREAPVRDWDIRIPADYSVVSVTGAKLADYIRSNESDATGRNLKVIFSEDVSARNLIRMMLEKNVSSQSGEWIPPKIQYPGAKSVRGDLGFSAAPGFQLAVTNVTELVERPLSAFPGDGVELQHYFRLRDPDWEAELAIRVLEKNIQADVFHLYSINEGSAYGSVLINYFVTGSPTTEFTVRLPDNLEDVVAEGKDLRTQKVDGNQLQVSLHRAVIGAYTLLVTFQTSAEASIEPGLVYPENVSGESGYIQVVSPGQVTLEIANSSAALLQLDQLELPPEYRLLSASPSLGIWQYNARPFELQLGLSWLDPERALDQVIEFAEATTLISRDKETVTDLIYYVRSGNNRPLALELPEEARIWDVRSNGRNVASRKSGRFSHIPLGASGRGENLSEVRLRLGNSMVNNKLRLPIVQVPVLKTEWHVKGGSLEVANLKGKYTVASQPVLPPSGFHWVGNHGLLHFSLVVLCVAAGVWLRSLRHWAHWLCGVAFLSALAIAIITAVLAYQDKRNPIPLTVSVPVLSAGEAVELTAEAIPMDQISFSGGGIVSLVLGVTLLAAFCSSFFTGKWESLRRQILGSGLLLIGAGLLFFLNGGHLFFGYAAALIFLCLLLPEMGTWCRLIMKPGVTALLLCLGSASVLGESKTAQSLVEDWDIKAEEQRLYSKANMELSGRPGDEFLLLQSPAILTDLKAEGLLLKKRTQKGGAIDYMVVIPSADPFEEQESVSRSLSFAYEMNLGDVRKGFTIPTGSAAVHQVDAKYDGAGWEFAVPGAARLQPREKGASLLLVPGKKQLVTIQPVKRDPASETLVFYVESQQVFVPSPGVVDGIHKFSVRPSRGLVKTMRFRIPAGFTVSEVEGPVSTWRFNPEENSLLTTLYPAQAEAFSIKVETQSGLGSFPVETSLQPVLVEEAEGHNGVVGLAFRGDAQPESVTVDQLASVNLDDFDSTLLGEDPVVLHRAYRFSKQGGSLVAKLTEVSPEIRVSSKQVVSLGDENLLLRINFEIDISRSGIFQLSFPLPDGLEVNSVSGQALHHWSEMKEEDSRIIVLHLNGKTLGKQEFSMSLNGPPPSRAESWDIPRFEIREANRQSGELVVQPATGIRLLLVDRENVSELDPRSLGASGKGALAFRLLQKDWSVKLDIETLDPRVFGDLLHDVTVRDAQIRTSISADFTIENAAIRSLQVQLPISDDDTAKTLRANGQNVSGIVKVEGATGLWVIQLKRWLTGDLQFQLEWEQRTTIAEGKFSQMPVSFPAVRQLKYYTAIRPTGRLEIELAEESSSWKAADWKMIPKALREFHKTRQAPNLTLKSKVNPGALIMDVKRHSLAEALKLRIARGEFRTILSPFGTRLTSIDLDVEVIQRSHLAISLPPDSEWFCLIVNREAVAPVRVGPDRWQFPVLPDTNGRKASVFAIYLEPNESGSRVNLRAPLLSVPMENIAWEVLSPHQLKLAHHDGNLQLIDFKNLDNEDRSAYILKAKQRRDEQETQAIALLEQANKLLQSGQQTLARQALGSVANRSGLDAASNEDARVQLETLQTQQALVGLNTRRQRIYLDRNADESFGGAGEQLRESASRNPVIQMGDLNFRPGDLSQLLQGNSNDDLAALRKIASRIVQQQQGSEIVPQGLDIAPPYEGNRYRFTRGIQVSETVPLSLDLRFRKVSVASSWRWVVVFALLVILVGLLAFSDRYWKHDSKLVR